MLAIVGILSILVFAIPICLNLISLKYLHDVKNESNCEEINSPYINIFFDYYLVELCFLLSPCLLFTLSKLIIKNCSESI